MSVVAWIAAVAGAVAILTGLFKAVEWLWRRFFQKPSIELSDQELEFLRLVEKERPKLGYYEGEPGQEMAKVSSWFLHGRRKWVRGFNYAPKNTWFFETKKVTEDRQLTEGHKVIALTDLGRTAMDQHRRRKVKGDLSLNLMDGSAP